MADTRDTMQEMIGVAGKALNGNSDADPLLQQIAIMWIDMIGIYATAKLALQGSKETQLGQITTELPND